MDKLSKTTISDAVVEYFRKKIQSGELKAGDKLPSERMLINQLGVSRFSLREGLARLSALGIIQLHQGKGAFVTDMISDQTMKDIFLPVFNVNDEKNFSELIEARIFLETGLARKAAKKRTQEDIEKLKNNLEAAKSAYDDPVLFARLDSQFHQLIANIADNKFFWRMQQLLHGAVDEFISENVKSDSSRIDAIKDHEKILLDIINQDEDNIAKTMPNHINVCVKHFHEKKETAASNKAAVALL